MLSPIDVTLPPNDPTWKVSPSSPHKCPVCSGRGTVPAGFYMAHNNEFTSSGTAPEKCRSCLGTGVIWG